MPWLCTWEVQPSCEGLLHPAFRCIAHLPAIFQIVADSKPDAELKLVRLVPAGEVEAAEANEALMEGLTEDQGTRIAACCLHADTTSWLHRTLPPDLQAPAADDAARGM